MSGKFRTWTFDSQGGYFDGYLTRDGDHLDHFFVRGDGRWAP